MSGGRYTMRGRAPLYGARGQTPYSAERKLSTGFTIAARNA